MKRLFMTLYADLSDRASQGAGWYVSVTSDEGMQLQSTLVSEGAVSSVVLDFERLIRDTGNEIKLGSLMTEINDQVRTALKEQLEHAERVAAQIPALRERLGATGLMASSPMLPPPPVTPPVH